MIVTSVNKEPSNLSICAWFTRSPHVPVPVAALVRIDKEYNRGEWWTADYLNSGEKESFTWEEAVEQFREYDGPYLLKPVSN